MGVYVDDMHLHSMGQFGRMKMCHMTADSTDELLAMADIIGVQRKWIQYRGTWKEHFDIATSKRVLAVRAGAKEITMREGALMSRARMQTMVRASDAL
ncbi:DUF4031 domain-containing protein [Lentilitoribacter sp. EG35]|uniref:DUF4031 domain-containing protein n=1 Tax=Lentilitoribacter sp. EG35 TaxID=3234192 RepID=UPI00345F81BD